MDGFWEEAAAIAAAMCCSWGSGQSSQLLLTAETFGYSVRVVFSIQDTSVLPILLHRADGYDDGVPQLFLLAPLLVVAWMHLLPSGMIPVI